MFLTIQLHSTCRKDRIHNLLQAKKNEDLFRRPSDDISKWRIISRVQWHHWCRTFHPPRRKGRPIQQEWCQGTVSRPEEKFIVPSCSRWKHRGIQRKICSMRLLMKRRHRLQRKHFRAIRSKVTWHAKSCVQIKEGLVWVQKTPMG